jgi:hypothetical protein
MIKGTNETFKLPLIDSFDKREFLISRILSGTIRLKIDGETVVYKWPSADKRYEALEIYNEFLEENSGFSESDLLTYMIENDMWSTEEEELLQDKIPKDIDNFKVSMFENILNTPKREGVRKQLKIAKEKLKELWAKRNTFYYLTNEGVAIYAKQLYLLESSIDCKHLNVNKIFDAYQNSMISEEDMRCLARTEPWRSVWTAHKKFGVLFPSELTEEQKRLVSWSIFYDSIYEHQDSPTDEIIDDDDILDGWTIKKRQEIDAAKQKQFGNNVLKNKHQNCDEVFLMVGSADDAKKVYNMNDGFGKAIQQSRLKAVLEKGEIKEAELPDRKMQIRQKLTQMESERFNK